MSLWPTAAAIAAVVGTSVGVFLLVRRRAPEGGFFSNGDRAAGVFGVLATGFSVLLGFIVFLAFTTYATARGGARAESIVLIQQFETAQLLAPAASSKLSGELVCYGRAVVGVEWPQLQTGTAASFNPWGVQLFRTLETVTPGTAVEEIAYAKWLDQTSERERARMDRVQAGDGIIPVPLWLILFVSAILVFLFVFLFADPAEGLLPQVVIVGTIAAMLATSMLVIRFLNDPYREGSGSLQPTEMLRVLSQIDEASHALGLRLIVPCDDHGRAL